MATRPVTTSLGSLPRNVLSRASFQASQRFAAVTLAPRNQALFVSTQRRPFTQFAASRSSNQPDQPHEDAKGRDPPAEGAATESAEKPGDEPWYLQVEPPVHPVVREPPPMPTIPADSPAVLEPLVKYVYEEMGLDDLNLMDLRDFDPPPALGPNLIMLFGTARSERHLHVASGRLVRWLRYNHKIESDADGLIAPGQLRTKLRRLRRKAKLLGSSSISRGGDDGISTGWICVNLGTVGGESSEEARFDSSGKLSGFGNALAETGSTVIVQVMTESRRTELNLETLWQDSLARNQRQRESFSAAPPREDKEKQGGSHPFFSAPPTDDKARRASPARPSWQPRKPFPGRGQRRSYATERAISSEAVDAGPGSDVSLHFLRRRVLGLQTTTHDKDYFPRYRALIKLIFSPSVHESHAADQIALAGDVLRILSQRAPDISSTKIVGVLLECMALSGSKSPILARAQANLESLATFRTPELPPQYRAIRLLRAFAKQGNWASFWEMWRQPPRYHRPRSEQLYTAMFNAVAASRDTLVCIEALRNCVHDMSFETPQVFPGDRLYAAILRCMAIADPTAVETADRIAAGDFEWHASEPITPENEWRMSRERILFQRHRDREFVRMIQDLRFAREQAGRR